MDVFLISSFLTIEKKSTFRIKFGELFKTFYLQLVRNFGIVRSYSAKREVLYHDQKSKSKFGCDRLVHKYCLLSLNGVLQVLWTSADTAQLRRGILRKATEVSNIQRLSDVRKAAKLDWDKIFFSNQQVVRKKSVTDNKYGA